MVRAWCKWTTSACQHRMVDGVRTASRSYPRRNQLSAAHLQRACVPLRTGTNSWQSRAAHGVQPIDMHLVRAVRGISTGGYRQPRDNDLPVANLGPIVGSPSDAPYFAPRRIVER